MDEKAERPLRSVQQPQSVWLRNAERAGGRPFRSCLDGSRFRSVRLTEDDGRGLDLMGNSGLAQDTEFLLTWKRKDRPRYRIRSYVVDVDKRHGHTHTDF